jgi:hypothetical protein
MDSINRFNDMRMNYNNPEEAWYHGMKRRPQGEGCMLSMLSVTFIALAIALMLAFSSCTTTRYVPVERHTTDTLIQTKVQKDSVWLHDSIHVSEKGDTIRIEKWHTRYIERLSHDTLYVAKRDSVPVPYEVTKEVPAQLSSVQVGLMVIGLLAILALILVVVYKLKKRFNFLP